MVDYCEQGKRAYYIASTIPADDDPPASEVLERLSHEFEFCVQGLAEVRREWERREPGEIVAALLVAELQLQRPWPRITPPPAVRVLPLESCTSSYRSGCYRPQFDRLIEEALGDHGKKLGLAGRAIRIEQRRPARAGAACAARIRPSSPRPTGDTGCGCRAAACRRFRGRACRADGRTRARPDCGRHPNGVNCSSTSAHDRITGPRYQASPSACRGRRCCKLPSGRWSGVAKGVG